MIEVKAKDARIIIVDFNSCRIVNGDAPGTAAVVVPPWAIGRSERKFRDRPKALQIVPAPETVTLLLALDSVGFPTAAINAEPLMTRFS